MVCLRGDTTVSRGEGPGEGQGEDSAPQRLQHQLPGSRGGRLGLSPSGTLEPLQAPQNHLHAGQGCWAAFTYQAPAHHGMMAAFSLSRVREDCGPYLSFLSYFSARFLIVKARVPRVRTRG